ncbi:hypothetical protein P167DRAFT_171833 [Morchella conica CCBAS932]|uniref:Uncharacterized protein n=1 Tax=Morchella conica CCBAS932 TaxID=1392247 RepID=A0A3N4KS85_9PEZI|nr:hypothetical protein P167DRAFT_171833 [Morchella conica CCBAS932]
MRKKKYIRRRRRGPPGIPFRFSLPGGVLVYVTLRYGTRNWKNYNICSHGEIDLNIYSARARSGRSGASGGRRQQAKWKRNIIPGDWKLLGGLDGWLSERLV